MAAPAGATTVSTEAQLRTAFTNSSETQVDLANDITLSDCSDATAVGEVRRNSNTALTLDGHGFTVTQTCPKAGVFGQSGGAATTFQNITITGGHQDNDDTCYGGGIRTSAPVTVLNSTIRDNFAHCTGGAMSVGSSLTVRNSTISGNTADSEGGGIAQTNGSQPFELTNSTVTGNTTTGEDPGGGVRFFGTATIVYSTIVNNSATNEANLSGYPGGGPASLTVFGTVVALPLGGGDNCAGFGTPTSSYNWDDDGTCGFTGAGDHSNAGDPGLGALASNGGPTQTREPLAGSPLIDAIPTGSCENDGASGITSDQRFLPRPALNGCDIGAVEVQPSPPPPPLPPPPGPEAEPRGPAQAVVGVARFTG